jgi:hypothetical protein
MIYCTPNSKKKKHKCTCTPFKNIQFDFKNILICRGCRKQAGLHVDYGAHPPLQACGTAKGGGGKAIL